MNGFPAFRHAQRNRKPAVTRRRRERTTTTRIGARKRAGAWQTALASLAASVGALRCTPDRERIVIRALMRRVESQVRACTIAFAQTDPTHVIRSSPQDAGAGDRPQVPSMLDLPDELVLHVFTLATVRDASALAGTCSAMHALLRGDEITWRGYYERAFGCAEAVAWTGLQRILVLQRPESQPQKRGHAFWSWALRARHVRFDPSLACCGVGYSSPRALTGVVYAGQWSRCEPHGWGLDFCRRAGGCISAGYFVGGEVNGPGVQIWPDGERYDGELLNNTAHGRGTWVCPDGHRYDGQWNLDELNGRGVCTYPAGGRYDGEWKDNSRDGRGALTHPNGVRYDGEWKNNLRHGRGVWMHPGGCRHDGEWRGGRLHGHGVWTHPDGSRYDGSWKDGAQHGHGSWTFSDGGRYDGEWNGDQPSGREMWIHPDGDRYGPQRFGKMRDI